MLHIVSNYPSGAIFTWWCHGKYSCATKLQLQHSCISYCVVVGRSVFMPVLLDRQGIFMWTNECSKKTTYSIPWFRRATATNVTTWEQLQPISQLGSDYNWCHGWGKTATDVSRLGSDCNWRHSSWAGVTLWLMSRLGSDCNWRNGWGATITDITAGERLQMVSRDGSDCNWCHGLGTTATDVMTCKISQLQNRYIYIHQWVGSSTGDATAAIVWGDAVSRLILASFPGSPTHEVSNKKLGRAWEQG